MARSTVSFGMLAARAASTAARRRGLAAGSGRPVRAAVVNSRMILVKTLARFLSCASFRYMMFLNWECPAIVLRGSGELAQIYRSSIQRVYRSSIQRARVATQYGSIAASARVRPRTGAAARRCRKSRRPEPGEGRGLAPPAGMGRPGNRSEMRQVRLEAAADPDRLDPRGQPGDVIGHQQHAAQG